MDIKQYLELNKTTQTELSAIANVTPAMVHQWIKGIKPISPEKCVLIERGTKGQITRKDLRPTDWVEIWPELKDVA